MSLMVPAGHRYEQIDLWNDGSDTLYCFLPSNVRPEDCKWRIRSGHRISLNGVRLEDDTPPAVTPSVSYSLQIDNSEYTLRILQSENLPTIYVETRSGNLDHLTANKINQEAGFLNLVNENGQSEYCDDLTWVSGRGNNTWGYEKKPWTLNLAHSASLLNMPQSRKWVLLANAGDDTNGLRNYLAFKMAQDLNLPYTSSLRFVDLYINHQYFGTFQIAEKIEIGENRLDFEAISVKHPNGGFILERNYGRKLYDKPHYFITDRGDGFVVRAPSNVPKVLMETIQQTTQQVEDALFSSDYAALSAHIDVNSWIDRYLVDEITKNEGAGATSSYFYMKPDDPLLYSGPVWDYDKSLGNYLTWKNPDGLSYSNLHPARTFWWKQFYGYPEVQAVIRSRYAEIYRPYLQNLLQSDIAQWTQYIRGSDAMNQVRWSGTHLDNDGLLIRGSNTLDDSSAYLTLWLRQRMHFLDDVWINGTEYCTVTIYSPDATRHDYVVRGQCYSPENAQDFYTTSGEPFDFSQPITTDISVWYAAVSDNTDADSTVDWYNYFSIYPERIPSLVVLIPFVILFAAAGLSLVYKEYKRRKGACRFD